MRPRPIRRSPRLIVAMAAIACASLASAYVLPGCGNEEKVNTLRLNLSLPTGWEDLLDMTVLGAPASTPYLGSVRITFDCSGVEKTYEAPYSQRSLVLSGLDLDSGCSVKAEGVTGGRVIFRKVRAGIPVGGGRTADLSLALEPANGFSAAGSLIHPRQYASAVLTGGRVLIVGGSLDTRAIEEYDIASGAMTAYAASLNYARTRQTAVLDGSGEKIFVFKGADPGEAEDNVYEVIDTLNNSSELCSFSYFRRDFYIISFEGIYLLGGYDLYGNWLIDSLFFDGTQPPQPQIMDLGLLSEINDGVCDSMGRYGFCAGGMIGLNYSSEIHRYDLDEKIELTTKYFLSGKRDFSAEYSESGKVIFSGGFTAGGYTSEVQELDIILGQLNNLGNIGKRSQHTSIKLQDGRFLIVGGYGPGETPVLAEIFDPATGESEPLPWRLRYPRVGHTATLLPDGRVLIVGGNMGTRRFEVFNPE